MPLLLHPGVWIAGGAAAVAYFTRDSMDDAADLMKWAAVGGAVYVAGRYLKVF